MALTMRNNIVKVTMEALSASTPKAIEWKESDERNVLVISASNATTLTVKAGDGIQGTADMTLTVPAGTSCVKLDSMRFKNVTGTNKGKIVIVPAGTMSVGVVALV